MQLSGNENGKKIEKSVNQDSTDYETCAVIWFGANVKLLPLLPLTDSGRFGKDGFANIILSKITEPRKTRFLAHKDLWVVVKFYSLKIRREDSSI